MLTLDRTYAGSRYSSLTTFGDAADAWSTKFVAHAALLLLEDALKVRRISQAPLQERSKPNFQLVDEAVDAAAKGVAVVVEEAVKVFNDVGLCYILT